MRRYVGGALVLLLVATACSSSHHQAAPEPPIREAWRSASITPIGQPVAEGDVAVVYGTVDKDLYLYGIGMADGAVRWRQPASPGLVVAGIAVEPTVIDHRVVYFRPDPSGQLATRLVVASPDTGADLFVSAPAFFLSHPSRCPDGADICLMALQGETGVRRRFSVDARGPTPTTTVPRPTRASSAPTSSTWAAGTRRCWPLLRRQGALDGGAEPVLSGRLHHRRRLELRARPVGGRGRRRRPTRGAEGHCSSPARPTALRQAARRATYPGRWGPPSATARSWPRPASSSPSTEVPRRATHAGCGRRRDPGPKPPD